MIPHHILNDLGPGDCVAILSTGDELRFVVHKASDDAAKLRAEAAAAGAEVLATHLRDKGEIVRFVRSRERDVGGEG